MERPPAFCELATHEASVPSAALLPLHGAEGAEVASSTQARASFTGQRHPRRRRQSRQSSASKRRSTRRSEDSALRGPRFRPINRRARAERTDEGLEPNLRRT